MNTPQILTGQQAIDQFGLNALIECRAAVTTELNGLGHSVMQIGVIADPDSCHLDEADTGVLWVEYQGDDDWYLYSIQADEQFVLLDDKNAPPAESNAVLAKRIAELTNERDALAKQVGQQSNVIEHIARAVGEEADPMASWESVEALIHKAESLEQEAKIHASELDTQKSIVRDLCNLFGLRVHDYHCVSNAKEALAARDAEVKAQAIRSFVSDTNETGQLSWSDAQWLEDWRDEWLSQPAKVGA